MLIPQDPKNDKQVVDSCIESIVGYNDFIVLDGQSFSDDRRSNNLSEYQKQGFIDGLLNSDVCRVSVSRGGAIPPYFGLKKVKEGVLRLDYYVARAVAEENHLDIGMIKNDMEILIAAIAIERSRYKIQIPDKLANIVGLDITAEGYV